MDRDSFHLNLSSLFIGILRRDVCLAEIQMSQREIFKLELNYSYGEKQNC